MQTSSPSSGFVVQVGSFKNLERANSLKNDLSTKGYPVFVLVAKALEDSGTWYRVVIGGFAERKLAIKAKNKVKATENIDSVIKWQDGLQRKKFP